MSRVPLLQPKTTITGNINTGSSRVPLLGQKTEKTEKQITPDAKATLDKYMKKVVGGLEQKRMQDEMLKSGQATFADKPVIIPQRKKEKQTTLDFLPQAIKETLLGAIGWEKFEADEPFVQLSKKEELALFAGSVPASALSIAKEFGKSAYGFLATAPTNIKALATGKEAPTEVKIPYTKQSAPLFQKTYYEGRKMGLSPFWSSVLTTSRASGDVLITSGVMQTVKTGGKIIGKMPVEKPKIVTLTRKDLIQITRGEEFAGKVDPAKLGAYKKLTAEGVDFFKVIKETGKINVKTGKPKTLAEALVEQYKNVKTSEEGFIINPFAKKPKVPLLEKGRVGKPAMPAKPRKPIKLKEPEQTGKIYHGTNVQIDKIVSEGFVFGKNSAFGKAGFFTDSENLADLHGENYLSVDMKPFKFRVFNTTQEQLDFTEKMKVDKLASAIRKQGEYDGFIVPNADPKVGTTYGITNNDLLNQALGVAKRTSIPQSILSKREIALKDDVIDSVWQSKYSEKYGKMASKAVELTKKVDMAKIGEKKTLERQLNKLTDKLADTEAGFLKEYYAEIHKKEKPIKEKEEKPVIKEKIILIKKGKIGQSQAEILAGLEKVKAGKREAVRDDNGFIKKWTGERSTFPKWIPSNLRQAKIVKPVIKHIYGKTEPKKADEIRLYNVVAKKIQETSYLEKVQKEITEKITKKAPVVKEKIKGKERIEKIKLTAKEKRQNILDKIKMQNDTVQAIKQEIVNYAKQYLDLKEKGKLLATVKNAKTFKDLDKAKIYIEKLSEEAGQRIIIKKIQKAIKETVAKGKIPKGKYTPEIQNVLNSIKKLTDLNQKNANLKIENNLREYAEKMPVEIALENKLLSLYTGTAKEKQELLNIINQLKEKGEVASALKSFNIQSDIQMKSSLVIERVTGGKGIEQGRLRGEPADKTKIEKVKQYLKAIGKKTILDWRGLMTASDFNASVKVKPLADFFSLVKNESKYKELQNKYIEKFNEAVSDIYKIKNKPNSILKIVNKIATDKIKVDKYEMTRDELIKRYMEIQDPTLIESFLRGNRYTDKTLEAIKNKITEQDKKFAEWQLDYYGKIYNQINAVYSNMTGVNLPFNKFYSPIKRIGHDTKPGHSELLDEAFYRKAVTNKSLISRIKNLSPIAKQGSMEVLDRHIANVNYYTAWAEKIRELDSVFTNNEVREAYKQEFPASLLSSIDNKIQHIATHGNKMASRIGWVDYVRKNYVIGNLAVKPALTVKQLVSTLAYAEKLSAKDLTIGILDFLKRPIKNYNILKNESAFIKTRGAGMERDIQDALREGVFSRYNKKQNLANAMLLNVKLGDKGAIVLGSWAMRKQRLKSGVKLKDVITEYEEFGSDTQQSADISRLSEIQLGGSIEKLFTIFKSSQRAYFQKEVNAIKSMFRKDGFGKENLKKVAKTLWIYHILLPVFFQWVANMGGWDKDDKKDYLRAGILGSLNGLFIAGDVIDGTIRQVMKMNVWDIEIIIADIGDDINKIISNLTEDDVDVKDIQTALDAFASASTGVSGLPVEYSYDILESLYNENYETGIKQILGWSEYVIGAPKKEKTKTPVIRTRKKRTPRKRRRR